MVAAELIIWRDLDKQRWDAAGGSAKFDTAAEKHTQLLLFYLVLYVIMNDPCHDT